MPHLKYCNRYWRVAGDEFSIPALCSIVSRSIWTCLIIIALSVSYPSLNSCSYGWTFISYLLCSILSFALSIICDTGIFSISLQGSIVQFEKRSGLDRFLTMRIVLGLIQLACAFFGIVTLNVNTSIPCESKFRGSTYIKLFVSIVVISQLVDMFSVLCCCYMFSANKVNSGEYEARDEEWAHGVWEDRCRSLTKKLQYCSCNLIGGGNINEGFEEVAKVLTTFFHHDGFLDVVPSDVVAGIILARVEQRSYRRRVLGDGGSPTTGISGSVASFSSKSSTINSNNNSNGGNNNTGNHTSDVISTSNVHMNISLDPEWNGGNGSPGSNTPYVAMKDGHNRGIQLEPISSSGTTTSSSSYQNGDANSGFISTTPSLSNMRSPADLLNYADPADAALMEEIYRYSIFAMAMYTHLIVVFLNPFSGMCRLCSTGCGRCTDRCCDSHCSSSGGISGNSNSSNSSASGFGFSSLVEGDNSCGLHQSGLSVLTKELRNTELIYASFVNTTTFKPFAVFLDHETQSVVIAIRGTLSLEDCITDVALDPIEMSAYGEEWGFNGQGRWAHGGMLKAAHNIRLELRRLQILEYAFGTNNKNNSGGSTTTSSRNSGDSTGNTSSSSSNLNPRTPFIQSSQSGNGNNNNNNKNHNVGSYKLIVTGHSLGAGTAVLLCMMLQNAYPSVKCLSYGTPNSVVDSKTADDLMPYVTSVVMNHDIVCRLSFTSLCSLRSRVLRNIARCKVNKMYIMQAIFREVEEDEVMYDKDKVPDSPFNTLVNKFERYIEDQSTESIKCLDLCIPGRVVHFLKEKPPSKQRMCSSKPLYQCYNAHRTDFKDIHVSISMGFDHLPDKYLIESMRLLAHWNDKPKNV